MNSADRLKARWNYDPDTPRCGNCAGYRRAAMRVHMPREQALVGPMCAKGKFPVQPTGSCDKWSHRLTGERLERQETDAA